ncbi:hypothetical protein DSO57_1024070 [Entomophthora muscae]|uniref:Uncharacterized protein n=1 Tax=Entomophthora muscae TaxID=34485 RepID=A0ACC2RTN3_9FUNG|nr:hypothetical protein DSO57_1024070 [Entomophthora muscae]
MVGLSTPLATGDANSIMVALSLLLLQQSICHLAMITVPIGSVIAGLNLGALAHHIGSLFPVKWVPDNNKTTSSSSHIDSGSLYTPLRKQLKQH